MKSTLRILLLASFLVPHYVRATDDESRLVQLQNLTSIQEVLDFCRTSDPVPRRALVGIASSMVIVPAVVNLSGLQGAFFRTKTTIFAMSNTAGYNPSALVSADFYGSDGTHRHATMQLGPSETRTFANFLQDVFGIQGAGGLVLSTNDPNRLIVSNEIYNDSPAGRFSTVTAVYTSLDYSLGPGYNDMDITTGVTVNSTTRANIACFNNWIVPTQVITMLFDAPSPGTKIKQWTFNLPAYGWAQIAVDVSVSGGTIIWAPDNKGFPYCYAVNVDNTSNDGTYLDRTTLVLH